MKGVTTMHDSVLKDIQLTVAAYIEEQLAKKDEELQLLKQQYKQLQLENKKLRQQNTMLQLEQRNTTAKKAVTIHSVTDAEKAAQFIASTSQDETERIEAFFILYRWNIKHLHYTFDALLALWTALATSVKKLPRITPELKHFHTQLTAVTSASYETFLTLVAHYYTKNDAYFAMLVDVFYKQALKLPSFQPFALTVMYAYKVRNEQAKDEPLYDALWEGQVEPARRYLKGLERIVPLLPQTGVLRDLTTPAKPKKTVSQQPTKEWDSFIAQATNGKFDRFTVVQTFTKLVSENKKTNMYTRDFLRSIWKRIFTHYDVAYTAFEPSVKAVKLHEYFIEADGQGVFSLIRLYNEHDAKVYMRALLDAVVKQLIKSSAYKPFDVPILLAIYYSGLAARYFANDKIHTYYTEQATERAQKMTERFFAFSANERADTFKLAYEEVQMVDVYLEKIGVNRKQFGSRVFGSFYNAPIEDAAIIDFSIPHIVDTIENPEAIQTLSPHYSLVRFGYKVKNTTASMRWDALVEAVQEIGLARTVQSLQYYIRLRLGDEEFAPMIALWTEDIARLQKAYVAGEL